MSSRWLRNKLRAYLQCRSQHYPPKILLLLQKGSASPWHNAKQFPTKIWAAVPKEILGKLAWDFTTINQVWCLSVRANAHKKNSPVIWSIWQSREHEICGPSLFNSPPRMGGLLWDDTIAFVTKIWITWDTRKEQLLEDQKSQHSELGSAVLSPTRICQGAVTGISTAELCIRPEDKNSTPRKQQSTVKAQLSEICMEKNAFKKIIWISLCFSSVLQKLFLK